MNKSFCIQNALFLCAVFAVSTGPVQAQQAWCGYDYTYPGYSSTLDVCFPGNYLGSPGTIFPVVIAIHGGGWNGGDKSWETDTALEFARQGYVAYSINYRLSPADPFPAQYIDVATAIDLVRATATDMRIDPNRIAVHGTSAGGHLALLAATYPMTRPYVKCAIARAPLTDLAMYNDPENYPRPAGSVPGLPGNPRYMRDIIGNLFAVAWHYPQLWHNPPTRDIATLNWASPLTHVTAGLRAKFHLEYGGNDGLATPYQSTEFANRVRSVGGYAETYTEAHWTHPDMGTTPAFWGRATNFLKNVCQL